MTAPKRIVVVDDDAHIRRLLHDLLPAPEFEVSSFADARDALARLPELRPDLIVCDVLMPQMDGRSFFRLVKKSDAAKQVPFIFLSGVQSNEEIANTLDAGADDFVNKPFHPRRLQAKVRAVLRMSARAGSAQEPPDALAGSMSATGTLPLLKFCEDSRLTGRLAVESGGRRRWADFLGGEMVHAGGEQEAPGEDPLDALLAMEGGTYRIEQKRLDAQALEDAEQRVREGRAEPAAQPAEFAALIPGGRLSRVDVRGTNVEIQTEGENRPNFTVTTVVARGGAVLRKIETSWQHPLKRTEDQEVARSQIDRQHDRVVATIRELSLEGAPRRTGPGVPEPGVDASLLAWAASFIAEQARDSLGSVMTVALLRRTHRRMVRERESLRAFRIAEDGRVTADAAAGASVPRDAVGAVAAWAAAFLSEAAGLVEKVGAIRIRQATRMMEGDLEAIGFYEALEKAMKDGRTVSS